jgi:hypothetical protein
MINVGDRLVVHDSPFPAYVESILYDPITDRTIIFLDWKEYGKSRVYMHDEDKVWVKYIYLN